MCLPQGSWPYNRDMSGSPVSGREAHKSRAFEAIPPLGYWGRKMQKLLRAASIRERINSIRPGLTGEGPRPIDGTIIFPPVDPTRTLQPHRDALILFLEIGDFDVRRILVDPAARPILYKHRSLATWDTVSQTLKTLDEYYSGSTDRQPHPWETLYCRSKWPNHSQRTILGGARVITLQCHFRPHMASLHESHPFYISSNGEFPHQRGAD
ncbi:hypothetical protein CK203_094112 [Vitis vinifera]|uniref:Uncharacterized protein n=1 Tax=Vitis vinifera TaxID=29760 RepID=A0A438CXM7_VITVI|nr:hypothetical protein CK203_094112 [Vitis vinifera]